MKFKKLFEVYDGIYKEKCFELSFYRDGGIYINWLEMPNRTKIEKIEKEIEEEFLKFKKTL